jgi:hypothetical protein
MMILNEELGKFDNLIPEDVQGVNDRNDIVVFQRPEFRREDDYAVDRTELRKLSMNEDDFEYDRPEDFDETGQKVATNTTMMTM